MIWRNLPIILLSLIFCTWLLLIVKTKINIPKKHSKISTELVLQNSFTGRMTMPNFQEIYVLENSANQNLQTFETFLRGRAAGLHWLSVEHFKNHNADILLGLKLTLDSLGIFKSEIIYSNTDDKNFCNLLQWHISSYWHYPKSAHGKFIVMFPLIWRAKLN